MADVELDEFSVGIPAMHGARRVSAEPRGRDLDDHLEQLDRQRASGLGLIARG